MQKLISIIFLFNIAGIIFAQSQDEVTALITEQLVKFPHEKIYVQTDKAAYLSGERVWFRSHLVEASTNMPAFVSRYVYVELFSPFDQLIKRIKIRPDSIGVYSGYLDLDEELPEGGYTIRAYTRYMRNQGNEAFFKKTIQVLDPYSLRIDAVPNFVINGNKVSVNFRFMNAENGNSITPEIVTLKLVDETTKTVSSKNNIDFNWDFTLTKKRNSRNLLMGIVYNGRKYNKFYPIPYQNNDFDITFHPEGGYLVPDRPCQVGFKAINPSGLGEEVTGTLFNAKDEEIMKFRSLKFGMGFLNFIPKANEQYYVVCQTNNSDIRRVDLPIPDARSRTISARIAGENRMVVTMLRGDAAPEDSVSLLIHSKGVVYYHQPWEDQSGGYSFAANIFPTGIISILLLNNKKEILSERLVFNVNENNFASVETESSSPSYKQRQLISLKLRLTDSDTIAFSDNIAVSVTDKNIARQDTANSILSTLLLSSELKGFIESPASYFKGYKVVDRHALDALMMTQGWRRYNIPDVLQGKMALPGEFLPEQSHEIRGRSEVLFGGLKEGNISLYATLDTLFSAETTKADEKGRFLFNVEYPDGTQITVQSLSKKGGRNNLINIDPETFPDYLHATVPPRIPASGQPDDDFEAYLRRANEEYTQKYGIRTIMLDEVIVTAKSKETYTESKFYSPIYASGLVTSDEIEKRKVSSLRSLLFSTPGVIVKSDKVTTTRSEDPVLFVIDDITYEDFFDQLDLIDVSSIDNLFVLRDNVGMLGYYPNTSGAVVITTKKGFTGRSKSMNIDRIKPLGFQLPVEFYAPKYETAEQQEWPDADNRTTIYWKPNVQFSKTGEALLEFYSADTATSYQVIGEGVTSSGKMIRLEKEIAIEGAK